jgi:hypothetical protein
MNKIARRKTVGVRLDLAQINTLGRIADALGMTVPDVLRQLLPTREEADSIVKHAQSTPFRHPGRCVRLILEETHRRIG